MDPVYLVLIRDFEDGATHCYSVAFRPDQPQTKDVAEHLALDMHQTRKNYPAGSDYFEVDSSFPLNNAPGAQFLYAYGHI